MCWGEQKFCRHGESSSDKSQRTRTLSQRKSRVPPLGWPPMGWDPLLGWDQPPSSAWLTPTPRWDWDPRLWGTPRRHIHDSIGPSRLVGTFFVCVHLYKGLPGFGWKPSWEKITAQISEWRNFQIPFTGTICDKIALTKGGEHTTHTKGVWPTEQHHVNLRKDRPLGAAMLVTLLWWRTKLRFVVPSRAVQMFQ